MTPTPKPRRRHRWKLIAMTINHHYADVCRSCGIARHSRWEIGVGPVDRTYVWRDGKWRGKCPPCEPVEVNDGHP